MANRVTQSEVYEIIDTTLTDIEVFINTANLLVTSWLGSTDLSDEILKEIEKYLSAHVLSLRDQRTKSVGVDVLSESYQGQWGMGLNGTSYGQMCIMLDTTGTLGQMTNKGKRQTSFGVIGYHESN